MCSLEIHICFFFQVRDVLSIPAEDLDTHLCDFLRTLKKADGTEYEPDTLTSYHRGIDRALQDRGYRFSLVTSQEFRLSKKMLETRRREL